MLFCDPCTFTISGQWTIVPYENTTTPSFYTDDMYATFRNNVQFLTQKQGTPDWFIMRRFRFTSSVIGKILRKVSTQLVNAPSHSCKTVMKFFSLPYKDMTPPPQHSPMSSRSASPSGLNPSTPNLNQPCGANLCDLLQKESRRYTRTTMQCILNAHNETVHKNSHIKYGNAWKWNKLAEAIALNMSYEEFIAAEKKASVTNNSTSNDADDSIKSLMDVILSASFMAPVRTPGMAIGSRNEAHVLKNFPAYMKKHYPAITLVDKQVQQCGLLHLKNHPHIATSLDGVIKVEITSKSLDPIISCNCYIYLFYFIVIGP